MRTRVVIVGFLAVLLGLVVVFGGGPAGGPAVPGAVTVGHTKASQVRKGQCKRARETPRPGARKHRCRGRGPARPPGWRVRELGMAL